MRIKQPTTKAIVWSALFVAALASPAEASPWSGHAFVSRDTTAVFSAATDTLQRFADAVLMRVAIELGGPNVVMYARSNATSTSHAP